jgi:hypothetical protein
MSLLGIAAVVIAYFGVLGFMWVLCTAAGRDDDRNGRPRG